MFIIDLGLHSKKIVRDLCGCDFVTAQLAEESYRETSVALLLVKEVGDHGFHGWH
jgi:hypothetical protein